MNNSVIALMDHFRHLLCRAWPAVAVGLISGAVAMPAAQAQTLIDTLKATGKAISDFDREATLTTDLLSYAGPLAKPAGGASDGDWPGVLQCSTAIGTGAAPFSIPLNGQVRNGDMDIVAGTPGQRGFLQMAGRLAQGGQMLLRGGFLDPATGRSLEIVLRGRIDGRKFEAGGEIADVRNCVLALDVSTFAEQERVLSDKRREEQRRAEQEEERRGREAAERDKKAAFERVAALETKLAEQAKINAALIEEQKKREKTDAPPRRPAAPDPQASVPPSVAPEPANARLQAEAELQKAKLEHQTSLAELRRKVETTNVEMAFWDSIKTSSNPADYKAYLETYPQGHFASLARVRANLNPLDPAPADDTKTDKLAAYAREYRNESRHALLIGNAAYSHLPKLKNPVADVKAVSAALGRAGFKTTVHTNLGMNRMVDVIGEFASQIKSGGVALFYYAGHAVQVRGVNYLMPTDANPKSEIDVRARSIDVSIPIEHFAEARTRANIVVLDACRDNPLKVAARALTRGLAVAGKAPAGTLIAYSTAPDAAALDGEGEHSVYAAEFVRQLEFAGLPAEEVFKRLSNAVRQASKGAQVPWMTGSLDGDFYFRLSGN